MTCSDGTCGYYIQGFNYQYCYTDANLPQCPDLPIDAFPPEQPPTDCRPGEKGDFDYLLSYGDNIYVVRSVLWVVEPCDSCTDGIQNQGEEGVDCGGPCTPCTISDSGGSGGSGGDGAPAGAGPPPPPPPPPCGNYNNSPEVPTSSTAHVGNGSYLHEQSLFTTGGTFGTSFTLHYNSLKKAAGPLGEGWSHGFNIALIQSPNGIVNLRSGSDRLSAYIPSGGGYSSPVGDTSVLARNGDGTYVITYRNGHRYNFDVSGRLTSIVDRYGNQTTLTYQNGDLTTVTDPAGRSIILGYDLTVTPHRLTTVTDPGGKVYDLQYQSGRLWRVLNPLADAGSTERGYWEYKYNSRGLMETKRDPNGQTSSNSYHDDKRLNSSVDPNGLSRTLVYDATNPLIVTSFTEKDGGVWHYAYDSQNKLVKSKTDSSGKVTSFTYYTDNRLKSTTVPFDGTKRLTTFYTYDGYGNLLTETEPVDLSTYNPAIDPETVTDPSTLATLTPPIKPAFRYTYDTANNDRLTGVSDERGSVALTITYVYTTENGGEVVTATAPGNVVTVTKANPNGTIRETIDANGRSTTFTYYPDTPENRTAGIAGLLEGVTAPAGITITITGYDRNGNPLEIREKDGSGAVKVTSVREHDALNRLRKLTMNTTGLPANVSQYGYDLAGNLTSRIDPESHETTYQYNYRGQVTKVTDALLNATDFAYGASSCPSCGGGVDRLTAVTDARQQTTGFQYDQLGRLTNETDSLGKKLHYTYYDSGLVKEKYDASTTPERLLVSYEYNNRGQLVKKRYPDSSEEGYSYDANGRLATVTNPSIGYTYTYYDNGRLHTVTDSQGRTISYDLYDGLGQRKQVTYLPGTADQRQVVYNYDTANRPQSIASAAGLFTYGYDPFGRRSSLAYPNQVTAGYAYDGLDRLTGLTHNVANGPPVASFTYTHDQAGNRLSRTSSEAEQYIYDITYRLLNVVTGRPETFSYDVVGNRQTGPGAKDTGYQHDAGNRISVGRRLQYQYDNAGNQTQKSVPGATDKSWTQTWDNENRLVKVEKVKGAEKRTVTFAYDPLGRRIGKQLTTVIDGITKTSSWNYLYDNEDIVLESFTDENGMTTKTFYTHGPGIDEPLALERSGQFYYYHADGLGSIVSITDSNRAVVQTYEYDSFGMAKPSAGFRNSYTYTGREWDRETGLYYYRARYYDPMDGRFISKDPSGFRGGDTNLYAYVQNNPINYTDPTGLFWFRQDWQTPGVVGRPGTPVPPGGTISELIERNVPAGYTFGEMHDGFVDAATSVGIPDALANIPSMVPMYITAMGVEMLRTLGIIDQPKPTRQPTPCK